MDNQVVRLNNVGKKFQRFINLDDLPIGKDAAGGFNNGAFWAVRNIYLGIDKGETIGVIGRNGSGKSTLLNMVCGSFPASEGEVIVNGKVSALLALGAGFQDEFTGKENIYLNASLLGMKKQEIEKVFMDIVEFSELGDFINAPLGSYSAGMKMRLGFSIAIHRDFDILVTDELITVGDMSFQKKCFAKMSDFKKQGRSMLIATQDMGLIERFCDKAFLLEDGKIFYGGNPAEVIEQYQMLLSKRKILSERPRLDIVTQTKRWAVDMNEWGKKEGSKEVTIEDVAVIARNGKRVDKVKCGEKLTIRVDFSVNGKIDIFHFGIAVFREDGVYCYGPNTQFDGLAIDRLEKGDRGYFELEFNEFRLMPGTYYLSVAIWDRYEVFAYDYHKCFYKIEVAGQADSGQLFDLEHKWGNIHFHLAQEPKARPVLDAIVDKWENSVNSDRAVIDDPLFLNNYGCKDNIFVTGREFRIKINFNINASLAKQARDLVLWAGIYRSDGVYCHGTIRKIVSCGSNSEVLTYPKLKLLPGEYRLSLGIWDMKTRQFLAYVHGRHSFNMVSDIRDHGTAYLEHCWRWKIKKEERSNAG